MNVTVAIAAMALYLAFAAWMMPGDRGARPPLAASVGMISFTILAAYCCTRRPSPALAACCVAAAGSFATWQIMRLGYSVHHYGRDYPLIDSYLHAFDVAIGFDWYALLALCDANPELTRILSIVYNNCDYLMYTALLVALLWGRADRLLNLVAANFVVLTIVHAVAYVAPSIGPYGYLGLNPGLHPNATLYYTDRAVSHVLHMREAIELAIPEPQLGLVNFPSYHTAIAVLFAWFFWATPLRWPALVVNAALLLATVIHGSHYLADVAGGALVTGLVLVVITRISPTTIAVSPNPLRRWWPASQGEQQGIPARG